MHLKIKRDMFLIDTVPYEQFAFFYHIVTRGVWTWVVSETGSHPVCLGRRGLYTGSSGLTVAYLSGVESNASCDREAATDDTHFTAVDVNDLRQSLAGVGQFRGVDLLLTSQWPRGVDKYATAAVSRLAPWYMLGLYKLMINYALTYCTVLTDKIF